MSLAPLTTLQVGGRAKRFVKVTSTGELADALALDPRVMVIGGGSNLVVSDAGWDGVVVQIAIRGTAIDCDAVTVGAGEVWDDFVAQMVEARRAGVECLSGIPGLVGATPMQNVGAYGQEVSETITSVRVYDRERNAFATMPPAECGFGYRTSVFRGNPRWIILGVTFRLSQRDDSMPIRYAELARALGIKEGERAPLPTVRDTVIGLRRSKGMVIDPGDPDSRSAGSFFTNPIVEPARVPQGAPHWPQPSGLVKVSAAWLIEQSGFRKGHRAGNVGISSKHALALVARDGATAEQLLALARSIQDGVRATFGIALEREPVVV